MEAKQVRRIESQENKLFKTWMKLLQPQGVNKLGQFLVSGEKLVAEALANPSLTIEALLVCEGTAEYPKTKATIFELKKSLFKSLDEVGTNSSLLVVQTPNVTDWNRENPPKGLEVFLALQDPGNLGAAIRSAAAFGASKVIVLKEGANPFSPKAIKAAAGAVLQISIQWGPSIRQLQYSDNFYALDGSGQSINDFAWPKDLRLLVGEEGQGVPDGLKSSDRTLKIPMSDKVESLNAAVALGISLHSWASRQKS